MINVDVIRMAAMILVVRFAVSKIALFVNIPLSKKLNGR